MRMTSSALNTQGLPPQPFFHTPEQRAALARQRFFEEGMRPSGLVSEAVIQSWARSRKLGHQCNKRPAVDPVSRSTLSAALNRNRELLHAANLELLQLEASLAGTLCRVLLTDDTGVIVHVTSQAQEAGQQVLNQAVRMGVNLAEGHVGTTAPGIVVHTGTASTVLAAEHYYTLFQNVRCAAAPIRDVHGRLAGVLDLSTESRAFGFDAASVVGLFATSIENRLLQAQSRDHVVLRFQATPALLGTPLEGLAGVSPQGQVVWINGAGRSLLGRTNPQPASVNELLGLDMQQLLDLCTRERAQVLQLPSGLGIWVRASLHGDDGVDFSHAVCFQSRIEPAAVPASADAPPAGPAGEVRPATAQAPSVPDADESDRKVVSSLAEAQHCLIDSALKANHGNVAKTARQLGVSRGLLYRHLGKTPPG